MNNAEKNAVIVSLMPYLQKRAQALASRSLLEAEDLAQEAVLKTLTMLAQADEATMPRLRNCADWAMRDAIRHSSATPRSRHDRARLLRYVEGKLTMDLDREPSAEEVADAMGMTGEELAHYRALSQPLEVVSTEQPLGEVFTVADTLAASDLSPEERLARLQVAARLRAHLDALPARERQVLELHDFEGLTDIEIGRRMNVTPSRISQLRRRARQMLSELLAPARQQA